MPSIYSLFIVVFLEGYVVLSAELLAIRQMLPFVGSGTDTTAIIISAVLVPLAFGYYTGGLHKTKYGGKRLLTIRKRLLRNLALSALMLLVALSYIFIYAIYYQTFHKAGISSFVTITALYSVFFLAPPIYLLGQTVPLLSNYMPKQKLSHATGKILFFSTLGSVAGAIFSTLVLMAYLGVHYTISITLGCLFVLTIIIARQPKSLAVITTAFVLLLSLFFNSDIMMQTFSIVQNNHYNMVQVEDYIYEDEKITVMRINRSLSSSLSVDEETNELRSAFPYIRYVGDNFVNTDPQKPKQNILIIGAGGFTVGNHDKRNNYTFVDIDDELLNTAEKYFLNEKLPPNKIFVAKPARAFLQKTQQKFDLIFIDIAKGPSGPPDHLVTKEFYQQVKNVMEPEGILVVNHLEKPNFSDMHSIVIDNTMRSVFKNLTRTPMNPYDPWSKDNKIQNVMYTYYNSTAQTSRIYTDNLNRQMFDRNMEAGH
jgi:spermidine synthase